MCVSNYGDSYTEDIKSYIGERIDFSFLDKIPSGYGGVLEQSQEFLIFLDTVVHNDVFLSNHKYTHDLLRSDITDRIIGTAFAIRDHIFEEISKESQFGFDKNDVINYINFLLVLKDILEAYSSVYITDFNQYFYDKNMFSGYFRDNASIIVDEISENHLKMVSPIIIATAVKSFFPYDESVETIPILSRLVAIFSRISKMLSFYSPDINQKKMPQSLEIYDSIIISLYSNASFFALDKNIIKSIKIFSKIL